MISVRLFAPGTALSMADPSSDAPWRGARRTAHAMHLSLFLDEALLCITRSNGTELAEMLRVCATAPAAHDHASRLDAELRRSGLDPARDPPAVFRERCFAKAKPAWSSAGLALWRELVEAHLRVVMLAAAGDAEGAFSEHVLAVQTSHRIFMSTTRWILPVVHVLNDDLWRMARALNSEESVQECARTVNKTVTICLTDRCASSDSRKWGAYRMAGLLFRIYFHLGQLNLCNNVLRAMGAADLPAPARYPAGHLVIFRFYLGRYFFVNEDYGRAEEELQLALAHCPASSRHNKRRILHFLIPVRLLNSGQLPSPALLARHALDRTFYPDAIGALFKGDLQAYIMLLGRFEGVLLKLGTFLVWEKLLLVGYRSLLHRIYRLTGCPSRVPLASLVAPLRSLRLSMNVDEISCFVANLIDRVPSLPSLPSPLTSAQGLIKGYLSQEKQTLVLSQKDPFPPLSAARLLK